MSAISDTVLPDTAVVFVSHGGRGQPIYLNFGPGDHSVTRKQLTPQQAWLIARDLLEAARLEMWK
jgi:hypothetical protein